MDVLVFAAALVALELLSIVARRGDASTASLLCKVFSIEREGTFCVARRLLLVLMVYWLASH